MDDEDMPLECIALLAQLPKRGWVLLQPLHCTRDSARKAARAWREQNKKGQLKFARMDFSAIEDATDEDGDT